MDKENLFHFVISPEFTNRELSDSQMGMCGNKFTINASDRSVGQYAIFDSRFLINHNKVNCPDCLAIAKFERSRQGFTEYCEMFHAINPGCDFNHPEILRKFVTKLMFVYQTFSNNANGYCDICGEPRTYEDIMNTQLDDYLSVCSCHSGYSKMIQVDIVRRILGITEVSNIKFTKFFSVE